MTSTVYALNPHDNLLHDIEEPFLPTETDALAASGDLFVTLATELDGLCEALALQPGSEAYTKLEKLISSLLYLQRHYSIGRKHSDYRQ